MTIDDYWSVLRRSWALVILAPLLGVLIGFGVSKAVTPVYQAQAAVFVSIDTAGGAISALTAQQRMDGYRGLATSAEVLGRAAQSLESDTSATDLTSQVSVSVQPATTVLVISATAPTADKAAATANAVAAATAEELSQRGSQEYVILTRGGKEQTARIIVQADVVTRATAPPSPVSPRTRSTMALGLLLGLVVGLAVPVVRESLAPRVRSPRDLEDALGAPFLGKVRAAHFEEDMTLMRAALAAQSDVAIPAGLAITSFDKVTGVAPVAIGLASLLATEENRVLIIQAGTPTSQPGLSDFLNGEIPLTDVLVTDQERGFDVLLAGRTAEQPPNPTGLNALLADVKQRYDWVVVQAPDLDTSAESVLLCAAVDGTVVVATQNRTAVKKASACSETLARTGAQILGAVLT